jgi:hypothetical protein
MLLSARFLTQVSSVNAFNYADNAQWTAGDTVTFYFQLVDLTLDRPAQGFFPAGRRYMPAVGATLTVTLSNIDTAVQIANRSATQAFPTTDPSIWSVTILNSDLIRGTCDLVLTLREGANTTTGRVSAGVLISTSGAF